MSHAILRGSRASGYRSGSPLECPCCHASFDVRGVAAEDKQGPHLVLYPVAPKLGEYSAADLRYVLDGPKPTHLETGVMLPRPPGKVKLPADPVPRFDGED